MIVHPLQQRSGRLAFRGLAALSGDRTAAALSRRLDDAYHCFRHVAVAGRPAIDAVVVGPGGTWTITLAELRGRFRKRNGHWYRWNGSTESWIPWDAQPVHQARLAGHRLELFLERATLPTAVEAGLIPSRGAEIGWEPGQRPGVHVHADLERLAARILRDEVLTPAQVDRIVALLDPRQPMPRLATSSTSS
ncbi:MAG: nuclease-related domain-containing protein [Candidatus Limnocylindria bacterium]